MQNIREWSVVVVGFRAIMRDYATNGLAWVVTSKCARARRIIATRHLISDPALEPSSQPPLALSPFFVLSSSIKFTNPFSWQGPIRRPPRVSLVSRNAIPILKIYLSPILWNAFIISLVFLKQFFIFRYIKWISLINLTSYIQFTSEISWDPHRLFHLQNWFRKTSST